MGRRSSKAARTSALEREVALAAQAPLTPLPEVKPNGAAPPAEKPKRKRKARAKPAPAPLEPTVDKARGLRIKYLPLAELIPYARNARKHSDGQVAQIAGSIREFGFVAPVVVDGAAGILAGHGRVLAAERLRIDKVPCVEAAHLTEGQRRAYVLADNKIGLNATWDKEMLAVEMGELRDMAADLNMVGFSDSELTDLIGAAAAPSAGKTDEDAAPELAVRAVSRQGDLWELGAHRLICGSSTDKVTVERTVGDLAPGLMVTDPPYGVAYDANWRNEAWAGGIGTGRSTGAVPNDDRSDWSEAWRLFGGDVCYVWCGALPSPVVFNSLEAERFEVRGQLVWNKQHFVIGRGNYHFKHEVLWYAVRKGKSAGWVGGKKQSTVWDIAAAIGAAGPTDDVRTDHSTQKPVECMRWPMENNSKPGAAVYEPFMGSGTSLIAAETIGRVSLGVEIHPLYVDMAIKRWQAFTGQPARLAGDRRTFAEVGLAREAEDPQPESLEPTEAATLEDSAAAP